MKIKGLNLCFITNNNKTAFVIISVSEILLLQNILYVIFLPMLITKSNRYKCGVNALVNKRKLYNNNRVFNFNVSKALLKYKNVCFRLEQVNKSAFGFFL